jgi:hypothetical protein
MSSEARNRTPSHDVVATIDDREPTVRTPTIDTEVDALPDQAILYEAPRRLPAVSEHKTLDMVPVRLAPDVDPRRARTQRLSSPGVVETRRFWLLAGVLTASVLVVAALLAWISRSNRAEIPRSVDATSTPPAGVAHQIEFVDMAGDESHSGSPSIPSAAASPRRVKTPKAKPAPSASSPPLEAARKEKVWLE